MVEDKVAPDRIELEQRIDALTEEAYRLRETENFDRMLEIGGEAKRLSEEIHYLPGIGRSLGVLAFVHYLRSDLHLAIDECVRALQLLGDDPVHEGRLRGVLALIHWSLGNYDEMTREGDLAMELLAKSPDRADEAFGWVARAGMSHSLGDFNAAREHSEQALKVLEHSTPQLIAQGRAYAQIGAAHMELGDLDKALEFHRRALACGEESGNRLLISRSLNEMGATHWRKGDEEAAEKYLLQALQIRTDEGYSGAAITSLIDLGRLYLRRENLDQAMEYAVRAEKSAGAIGARPKLADAYQLISAISEKRGDLGDALSRFKAYQQIRETITGEQNQLRLRAMRLMAQVETLRAEQAATVNAEKMAAVGSLVAALAHEMNSPLGVIRSSADTLVRATARLGGEGVPDILRGNAETVSAAADRISSTIARLKSFAGIDLAEFREADLLEGIEQALEILAPEFGRRVVVVRDFQPIPRVSCFPAELNQVFLHLLRNCGQAIDGPGEVRIGSRPAGAGVRLSFADTGRGIAAEDLPRIFNAGFNREEARVRASLSLFTCLNIVQKHKGTIDARSVVGQGSTFTVTLPVAM